MIAISLLGEGHAITASCMDKNDGTIDDCIQEVEFLGVPCSSQYANESGVVGMRIQIKVFAKLVEVLPMDVALNGYHGPVFEVANV